MRKKTSIKPSIYIITEYTGLLKNKADYFDIVNDIQYFVDLKHKIIIYKKKFKIGQIMRVLRELNIDTKKYLKKETSKEIENFYYKKVKPIILEKYNELLKNSKNKIITIEDIKFDFENLK